MFTVIQWITSRHKLCYDYMLYNTLAGTSNVMTMSVTTMQIFYWNEQTLGAIINHIKKVIWWTELTLRTYAYSRQGLFNKYLLKIGPVAKCFLNGVSLACRWWLNIECWNPPKEVGDGDLDRLSYKLRCLECLASVPMAVSSSSNICLSVTKHDLLRITILYKLDVDPVSCERLYITFIIRPAITEYCIIRLSF